MRALTIKQPWVWAICCAQAGKDVENRSRPIPTPIEGQRIAIHAGVGVGSLDLAVQCLRNAGYVSPNGLSLRKVVTLAAAFQPKRAIVAVATITNDGDPVSPWAIDGLCHWQLSDVVVFTEPVPQQRGQLGLWRLSADTEKAVRKAEAAARGRDA